MLKILTIQLQNLFIIVLIASGVISCGDGSDDNSVKMQRSIPEISLWREHMILYGEEYCSVFSNTTLSFDERLNAYYYDAQWVYYQIADYTGDDHWLDCAKQAGNVYRDEFILPNNGLIQGYWVFPHGLKEDVIRNGSRSSRKALDALVQNAAFLRETTNPEETLSTEFSRETAYAIDTYLAITDIGGIPHPRLHLLVEHALGHLESWFVRRDASHITPFMVALTAEALIDYHSRTEDPRVVPALQYAMDILWDELWLPEEEAFKFRDRVETEPSPDLNLLIAPVYAFLYFETGENRFRERGDAIFAGGVRNAFLGNPKQFNQNYRRSIRYVELRQEFPKRTTRSEKDIVVSSSFSME